MVDLDSRLFGRNRLGGVSALGSGVVAGNGAGGMDTSMMTLPDAVAHCERMRQEMITALDHLHGPREWHGAPQSRETHSYDSDGREAVRLVTLQFEGTYPPPVWRSVGDLVAQIGRRYGFTDVRVLTEQPGRFDLAGGDDAGGIWRLSMAVNTELTVRTPMVAPAGMRVGTAP